MIIVSSYRPKSSQGSCRRNAAIEHTRRVAAWLFVEVLASRQPCAALPDQLQSAAISSSILRPALADELRACQ